MNEHDVFSWPNPKRVGLEKIMSIIDDDDIFTASGKKLGGNNERVICELLADFLKLQEHPFGAPSAVSDWNVDHDEGYMRAALESAVRWLREET